jgi:hypothetical protein
MIDSIKVGIPLTRPQHKRLTDEATKGDRWQWVLYNQGSGEMRLRRISGLAAADQNSYHRELRWDVPSEWNSEAMLTLEFSIPKFWYGHNVHLLYDWVKPLYRLKELIEQQFGMRGRGKLPDPHTWALLRADVCYAWRFPSQQLCHQFLCSLKRLHFPRKKPVIYDSSIVFAGTSYTVKIYEKLPEFKAHDLKEMVKAGVSLEFIEHCELIACGVLRFEATLRRRYLRKQGILTVGDLNLEWFKVEWVSGCPEDQQKMNEAGLMAMNWIQAEIEDGNLSFVEGETIAVPSLIVSDGMEIQTFEEQQVILNKAKETEILLDYFLTKFVGENAGMQTVDEVKAKLAEMYKPVKAARLVSFWLYINKFGTKESREIFGRDSYDYNKRELKKAGVSMIDLPSESTITKTNVRFIRDFKMKVPSEHAVNQYDDHRDSSNVLNYVPLISGQQFKA